MLRDGFSLARLSGSTERSKPTFPWVVMLSWVRFRRFLRAPRSFGGRFGGPLALAVALAWLAAAWLLLLPAVGRWGPVRERIEWRQREGLPPSAVFYTDLAEWPGRP
jgi:hypothetical protein